MLFKSRRFVCMDCGQVQRLTGNPSQCADCCGEIVPLIEFDASAANHPLRALRTFTAVQVAA